MPFREVFDCLWCGTPHRVRARDDLEGWAQLCPECLARAGANPFLRLRLKMALAERAAGTGATAADRGGKESPREPIPARPAPSGAAPAPSSPSVAAPGWVRASGPATSPFGPAAAAELQDDFYLRRGLFARGPIHDTAWNAELDAAVRWLDALPLRGEILELAAGTGWWSSLLAGKAPLTLLDESPARLDRARDRLLAHRLRAHLHARDRWAAPDRQVDALVMGPAIAEVPAIRLHALAELLHAWLRPGGTVALIDLLPDGALDATGAPVLRTHDPGALPAALAATGFTRIETASPGRHLTLLHATA
jgi:SAM-dependent methyltransferase